MIIITYLITFIIGVFIGSYAFHRMIMNAYENDKEQLIGILEKYKHKGRPGATTYKDVVVEELNNKCMMWTADTKTFVSQGNTYDEALTTAQERFPKLNFRITRIG